MRKTLFLLMIITMFASCDLFKGYQILSELQYKEPEPTEINIPITDNFAPDAENTWTFIIVLNGDSNLEAASIEDFNEMELGLHKAQLQNTELLDYLNIIVLFDRGNYSLAGGVSGWDETRTYKVLPDDNMHSIHSDDISDHYRTETSSAIEQNLGDPGVFTTFIDYCTANYTADHYALIVWNHGSGPTISNKSMSSFTAPIREPNYSISMDIDDGTGNYDELTMKELQTTLANTKLLVTQKQKIDLMGFDACLMASVEVAYQFRDQVDYLVASMEEEGGDGWNFETIFENMGLTTDTTYSDSRTLSKVLVQNYYDTYNSSISSLSYPTLSAIDLSKIEILKTKIDILAKTLASETNPKSMNSIYESSQHYSIIDPFLNDLYIDFSDICTKIKTNYGKNSPLGIAANDALNGLGEAVVAAYGHKNYGYYLGPGEDVKQGLYIIYPGYPGSYTSIDGWYNEIELDFCTTTDNKLTDTWLELLQKWFPQY